MKAVGAAALASTAGGCASLPQASEAFDEIPRLKLTNLPTACNKMQNVTKLVGGPDLFIKRDDVMELAHGGNKTRKLEYGLAEALNNGCKSVVTQGGLQSNHVRQTCSGAAKVGLESHVILSNPVPEMKEELMGSGNYLMDQLMGAQIYFAEGGRGEVVDKVLSDLTAAGKIPYNIPAGASTTNSQMVAPDTTRTDGCRQRTARHARTRHRSGASTSPAHRAPTLVRKHRCAGYEEPGRDHGGRTGEVSRRSCNPRYCVENGASTVGYAHRYRPGSRHVRR